MKGIPAMTPVKAQDPYDWEQLLSLIQECFAFMEGRIDPPSSMHRLTAVEIAQQARDGEVWVLGRPAFACVFLTPKAESLYVGKLAVAASVRRKGFARKLIDLATERAKVLGLSAVELQTRVELFENQSAFMSMGFQEVGRTSHPGFDRPTSITYRRKV